MLTIEYERHVTRHTKATKDDDEKVGDAVYLVNLLAHVLRKISPHFPHTPVDCILNLVEPFIQSESKFKGWITLTRETSPTGCVFSKRVS